MNIAKPECSKKKKTCTEMPSFSIAEYCLKNVTRTFSGHSYGRILIKEKPSDKKSTVEFSVVYRDRDGKLSSQKEIAEDLGISPSTVKYSFQKHFGDYKAFYYERDNKKINEFRFDDGSLSTAKDLAIAFGCSRHTVSAKYSEFNNDYIKANRELKKIDKRRNGRSASEKGENNA